MNTILVLLCLFIYNTSGQQVFLSKVNENAETNKNGPRLYLSRENPTYRQNKTNTKAEDMTEDIADFYRSQILGLDAQQTQNGLNTRKQELVAVPTHGNRPIHMSESSPLFKYLKNNHSESNKSNYEETLSELPVGDFVLKKNSPIILENGTLILGGYKFENAKIPNTNSYKIQNINVEDSEPVVKRISTIKFNGELVGPKFLQNYFSSTLDIFSEDSDDTDNAPNKFSSRFVNHEEEVLNKDGTGLIDVRSGFNIEPKDSKLSVLRRRGLQHKNATTVD